jgi:hypothetical protein
VLVAHGIEVSRTHDLRFLFDLAESAGASVPDDVRQPRWLTPWSVEFRHSEELTDPLDRAAAIAVAKRLQAWASTQLAPA